MVIMRLRYVKKGGHYHCRLFTRKGVGSTFEKNGDLVFGEEEWNEVMVTFECGGAEVVPEVERTGDPDR